MENELDPMEVLAVCGECGTQHDSKRMERNIFLQSGESAYCKYCGGVVILVERREMDHALSQIRLRRGLS